MLLNRLKLRIGIIPAILVSSFLFGIGHEFGGMISAFPVSYTHLDVYKRQGIR